MAEDLFHKFSPLKLRQEIAQRVVKDQRSLPEKAKIFPAVAAMQGFDGWPGLLPPTELDKLIGHGEKELNRGICGTKGLPAIFYAKELVQGIMFPGILTAFGQGIYLSTVSEFGPEQRGRISSFPRLSKSAATY